MKGVIRGHGTRTTYWLDGTQVSREAFDAAFPDRPLGGCASLVGWRPLHSEALAVHPDLVGEARADALAKGVPTDFDAAGCPVFRTRAHRKEYLERYGYFDRAGGYGDAQRGGSKTDDRARLPDDCDLGVAGGQHQEALNHEQQRQYDLALRKLRGA